MQNLATTDWTLDHVGVAVHDLDESIGFYEGVFGFALQSRETLPQHHVEVAFLALPNSRLELLFPLPGNITLSNFLSKRGPGLHHLAFHVTSVETELQRLEALGVELIDTVPRLGAEGALVAFLKPQSTQGVLIELLTPKT